MKIILFNYWVFFVILFLFPYVYYLQQPRVYHTYCSMAIYTITPVCEAYMHNISFQSIQTPRIASSTNFYKFYSTPETYSKKMWDTLIFGT